MTGASSRLISQLRTAMNNAPSEDIPRDTGAANDMNRKVAYMSEVGHWLELLGR